MSGEVVAWVSPLRHGSQVTFLKPNPPEEWDDAVDDWYCYGLVKESDYVELLAERDALRAFAQAVMEDWPEGDLDGGTRQDLAERHGILKSVEMFKPCSEECACMEFYSEADFKLGMFCLRKTTLLTGNPSSDERIAALTDQGRAGEGRGDE